MKRENIVRYDPKKHREGRTDWERLRRLTDKDIADAVASDPDAAPILTKEWFKQQGPKYQTRMNAVLKAYMQAHGKPAKKPAGRTKRVRSKE